LVTIRPIALPVRGGGDAANSNTKQPSVTLESGIFERAKISSKRQMNNVSAIPL